MAYTKLTAQHTPGARVEEISPGEAYRLMIPAGPADKYRLAQIYDYARRPRSQFALRPPLRFSISARTSSDALPGTWGFGLWNDPFGLSFGFGGNPWRLPALPNAAWFFGASKENYLSFTDARASSAGVATNAPPSAQRDAAANGFIAQVFRSPRFHPLLIPAGLVLPFSRRSARRLLGKVIGEEGVQLWSTMARRQEHTPAGHLAPGLQINPTQWHGYSLDWGEEHVAFEVDGGQVLASPVSPNPPLGLVIWIDNQYAAFTPEGKIGFGALANPEPAWLEVKDINLS